VVAAPGENDTLAHALKIYIIAQNNYTFAMYGDTIGDGIGSDGKPFLRTSPVAKVVLTARILRSTA
jgi:hypothetical protein